MATSSHPSGNGGGDGPLVASARDGDGDPARTAGDREGSGDDRHHGRGVGRRARARLATDAASATACAGPSAPAPAPGLLVRGSRSRLPGRRRPWTGISLYRIDHAVHHVGLPASLLAKGKNDLLAIVRGPDHKEQVFVFHATAGHTHVPAGARPGWRCRSDDGRRSAPRTRLSIHAPAKIVAGLVSLGIPVSHYVGVDLHTVDPTSNLGRLATGKLSVTSMLSNPMAASASARPGGGPRVPGPGHARLGRAVPDGRADGTSGHACRPTGTARGSWCWRPPSAPSCAPSSEPSLDAHRSARLSRRRLSRGPATGRGRAGPGAVPLVPALEHVVDEAVAGAEVLVDEPGAADGLRGGGEREQQVLGARLDQQRPRARRGRRDPRARAGRACRTATCEPHMFHGILWLSAHDEK